MSEACVILGIELKNLKRLCRQYNIKRWPKKTILDLNFKKEYKYKQKNDNVDELKGKNEHDFLQDKISIFQSNSQGSPKMNHEIKDEILKSPRKQQLSVQNLLNHSENSHSIPYTELPWFHSNKKDVSKSNNSNNNNDE
eukprot:gene10885-3589_t